MTVGKVIEDTAKKSADLVENIQDEPKIASQVEYDDILSAAGEFGLYQILLCLSTFPFHFFNVFVYFTQIFLTEVSPNHWCRVPELENLTAIERRTLAIPPDENAKFGYSKCKTYIANWTEVLITGQTPNETWGTQSCQHGWEFNTSEIPYPTISSELHWVCERDSYQATAQSIFFVGAIVGGILIGWIADRFGRLPAAVISNILGCIGGIASTFSKSFVQFAICRFIIGMACENCVLMLYLLLLEYVAPRYRTMISNLSYALFYALAMVTLPWLALLCGHWQILSLVTSVPMVVALAAPFIIPESPRWLLSKGRTDEAMKKLLTIGRINKKEVPPKLVEQFKMTLSNKSQEQKGGYSELFTRPVIRKMFICACLQYVTCTIVFDSLVRSIGQLEFDFFISFTVLSFTEFPSLLMIAFLMDFFGRKWLSCGSLIVSCVFSILTVIVGGGFPSVMCAVVARFAVNMAYAAAVQWAAEMLPTSVRGTGVSIIHICGYIGTVMSPYIVYLEVYVHWLPLVLVGMIAGCGATIAFMLPETTKKEMPQTFDDAEKLYQSQKFWEFSCLKKKNKEESGVVNDSFEI